MCYTSFPEFFAGYLEPFLSFKQNKFTILNSAQKVSKMGWFLAFGTNNVVNFVLQSILYLAAESRDKILSYYKICYLYNTMENNRTVYWQNYLKKQHKQTQCIQNKIKDFFHSSDCNKLKHTYCTVVYSKYSSASLAAKKLL